MKPSASFVELPNQNGRTVDDTDKRNHDIQHVQNICYLLCDESIISVDHPQHGPVLTWNILPHEPEVGVVCAQGAYDYDIYCDDDSHHTFRGHESFDFQGKSDTQTSLQGYVHRDESCDTGKHDVCPSTSLVGNF